MSGRTVRSKPISESERRKSVQRFLWLVALSLLLFFLASVAWAAEFRGGENVIIAAGEVIEDDLYVGGTTVTVDGTVRGDLVASGRNITVNGTVEGDLIAAGQTITVNGVVEDDIRIAGAALTFGQGARIGDDVVATGYSLETAAGSVVGGTLHFGGGQARLAGEVTGDANLGAGGLELLGITQGSVQAEVAPSADRTPLEATPFLPNMNVPSVAPGFTLGNDARIGGNLDLTTPDDPNINAERVGGAVRVEQQEVTVATRSRSYFQTLTQRFLALAAVGLLLLWLTPNFMERVTARLDTQPWTSLGMGALTLVGFPALLLALLGLVVLLVILFATLTLGGLGGVLGVIGLASLVILALLFVLTVFYLAYAVVAYYGGRWLLTRGEEDTRASSAWALLLGTLILVVLTSAPVIGPIAALFTILFGLGTLWRIRRRAAKPEPKLQKAAA